MLEPYYFGTYRQPGHYLWRQNQQRVKFAGYGEQFHWVDCELPWNHIDGRLNPPQRIEGQAFFYPQSKGYCGFAFANFTDDHRGSANSAFFIPGDLNFEKCLAVAKETFFWAFENFSFEVVQVSQSCRSCGHGYHHHRQRYQSKCQTLGCTCQKFAQMTLAE